MDQVHPEYTSIQIPIISGGGDGLIEEILSNKFTITEKIEIPVTNNGSSIQFTLPDGINPYDVKAAVLTTETDIAYANNKVLYGIGLCHTRKDANNPGNTLRYCNFTVVARTNTGHEVNNSNQCMAWLREYPTICYFNTTILTFDTSLNYKLYILI